MSDKIEIILAVYNDNDPPSDYLVNYYSPDPVTGELRECGDSFGSSVEELAQNTKFGLYGYENISFAVSTRLVSVYQGKDKPSLRIGQEGCYLHPLTEDECQRLLLKLEEPFTEEDYVHFWKSRTLK